MSKIYLDINQYIYCAQNKEYYEFLKSLKKEHNFFYSWCIAEENFNINNNSNNQNQKLARTYAVMQNIISLTDHNYLGQMTNGHIVFVNRDYNKVFNECSLILTSDLVKEQGEIDFEVVKILNEACQSDKIKGVSPNKVLDYIFNEPNIKDLLSQHFNGEDTYKYKGVYKTKTPRNFHRYSLLIKRLFTILNAAGFSNEKNEYTASTSIYDYNHVAFASFCDVFLTSDVDLFKKASAIYSFLGVKTQCIKTGNIFQMQNENLQKTKNTILSSLNKNKTKQNEM